MPERQKITVIIPTFNEERNLRDCLASVEWADEVFVVDSFSTDSTPEIVAEAGVRFIQHEYVNSAAQKNWAIPQDSNEWILVVDADERVTPQLREEILQKLQSPDAEAYDIQRENYFLGRRVRYCGWQNDWCVRLFARDKSRYQDRHVHADVEVDGRAAKLTGKLQHHTFDSFEQYMRKYDKYTTWAAMDRAKKTPVVRWHHLFLRPITRFFKQYLLKRGILDGHVGLIICTMAAFSVFLKYAKLWEIRQKGPSA